MNGRARVRDGAERRERDRFVDFVSASRLLGLVHALLVRLGLRRWSQSSGRVSRPAPRVDPPQGPSLPPTRLGGLGVGAHQCGRARARARVAPRRRSPNATSSATVGEVRGRPGVGGGRKRRIGVSGCARRGGSVPVRLTKEGGDD